MARFTVFDQQNSFIANHPISSVEKSFLSAPAFDWHDGSVAPLSGSKQASGSSACGQPLQDNATRSEQFVHSFLLPGDLAVAMPPGVLETVLGSCVALCLWDSRRKVGGMNHFVIPSVGAGGEETNRVGTVSIANLIKTMRDAFDCLPRDLQAMIFGGASVFGRNDEPYFVGSKNKTCAINATGVLGIPIVGGCTGGTFSRRITFYVREGMLRITRTSQSRAR